MAFIICLTFPTEAARLPAGSSCLKLLKKLSLLCVAVALFYMPITFARDFQWPVAQPRITQDYACFDCKEEDSFHSGVDIVDGPSGSCGDVKATHSGTVVRTIKNCEEGVLGCGRGFGNQVIIKHFDREIYTAYSHLDELESNINTDNPIVEQGQLLGIMGNTGYSFGCHLDLAVLGSAPPNPGDYDGNIIADIVGWSGWSAYPEGYPENSCGSDCIDFKEFIPLTPIGFASGGITVHELPSDQSEIVAELNVNQVFVAIASYSDWFYISLPSDVGPDADTNTEDSVYGWVKPIGYSPSTGYTVKIDGRALVGVGLHVRSAPDSNSTSLTKVWGGQYFWASETHAATSACDDIWYKISIPPSRALDNSSEYGWVCGNYVETDSRQCIPLSSRSASMKVLEADCGDGDVPVVTTNTAGNITQSSAQLNMTVNAGGSGTDVYFVWEAGDTTPDRFQTPTTNVGNSSTNQPYSYTISGLSCNTTYYFQAHASNANGSDSGVVRSFTTDACGGGSTNTEDLIQNGDFSSDGSFWSLSGDFYADDRFNNYNNGPGYAYLSEEDGTPGNFLLGTLYQQVAIPSNAESAALTYWVNISSDEPSNGGAEDFLNITLQDESGNFLSGLVTLSNQDETTGYVRHQFNLENFIGDTIRVHFLGSTNNDAQPTVFRIDDVSLVVEVPDGGPPSVTTRETTNITDTRAVLNARVNPNGLETDVWFDFEANDSTPNDDTERTMIGSGTTTEDFSLTVTGLACDTLYYVEANADNSAGSDRGSTLSFRTDPCPIYPPRADTDPARDITRNSARLTADIFPNGSSTDAWFEWGTTSSLGNATPRQNVGSGGSWVDFDYNLTGLNCGTEYYFEAHAENADGEDDGATHSFTTSACEVNRTLTVTSPTGGMITGTGINCGSGGSDCSQSYPDGTSVTLTATPDSGWSFDAWGGDCSGSGSCNLTMTANRNVSAIFSENSADDNYEENDTLETAYDLSAYEQTWLSSINGPGIQADDDWYEISVTSGYTRVVIEAIFSHEQGDIDIALYDAGGNWLAGSISTSDDEFIDHVVPGGGVYYIHVHYGNAGNAYDLRWDGMDDNYEENDTPATAYDLSAYEQTWLSSINGPGIQADEDWYEISVTSGYTRVVIEATFSHEQGDIDIALYDAGGNWLAGSISTSDDESIDHVVPGGGTYYMHVYFGDAGNTYDLWWDTLQPPVQDRILTVTSPTGGTITGTGINCGSGGSDCSQSYPDGTSVTLTATPDSGWSFDAWGGDCASAITASCTLNMNANKSVSATFTAISNIILIDDYEDDVNSSAEIMIQPGPLEGKDTSFGTVYWTEGNPDASDLRIGGWGDSYASFIEFDLSSIVAVDTIASATVHLYQNKVSNPNNGKLYRITESWSETDPSTASSPAAVDFGMPYQSIPEDEWWVVDVTPIVKDWLNGVYPNYGFKILGEFESSNHAKVFYSSDYLGNPALRPKLVISYE